MFAPERANETARLVAEADAPSGHDDSITEARHRLHAARLRLVQYRKALGDGAASTTLTAWITEAAEQERAARADVDDAASSAPPSLDVNEVLATIEHFGSLTGLLAKAQPTDQARLYDALGVTATYDASARTAVLEVALPRSAKNLSEGDLNSCSRRDGWCRRVPPRTGLYRAVFTSSDDKLMTSDTPRGRAQTSVRSASRTSAPAVSMS